MDANSDSTGARTGEDRECRRVRDWLVESTLPLAPAQLALSDHLAVCPDCAAFARRLQLARQALGLPLSGSSGGSGAARSGLEADPQFAARVLARIARPAELIGWAALRALPAALGLAVALAFLGFSGLSSPAGSPPSPPSPLLDDPPTSDQLLAWASLSPEVWP